jgi:EpsI family protein
MMLRFLAVLAMLGATAAYVVTRPSPDLAVGGHILGALPTRLGAWDGTELSFDDATMEYLDADDLIVRRYERGEEVVWLTIIYHRSKRYGAHDPILCYQSEGYAVLDHAPRDLDEGSSGSRAVNRFRAVRPRGERLVYYWWTTAGMTTADVGEFRRRLAFSGVLEGGSWGAFVRVETPVVGGGWPAAEARLAEFSVEVDRILPGVFKRAGGAGAADGMGTTGPR